MSGRFPHGLLTIAWLLAAALTSVGQQLPFRHFGVREGLADSRIFIIKQAQGGELLISTDNGLSVYDGYAYNNFYPKKTTGSNFVLDAEPLPDGRVLVSAYRGGLCFYQDRIPKPVHCARLRINGQPFNPSVILSLHYAPLTKQVWAVTVGGVLWGLRLAGDSLIPEVNVRDKLCNTMYSDTTGHNLYFGFNDGLYMYKNGIPVRIKNIPAIERIQPYKNGWLLLNHEKSATLYNPATGQTDGIFEGMNHLRCGDLMYDPARDHFWVPGNRERVFLFRGSNLRQPYLSMLPGIFVNYVFGKPGGPVWCGSFGAGLIQFFTTDIVNYGITEGLSDTYITHLNHMNGPVLALSCLKSFYELNTVTGRLRLLFNTDINSPVNAAVKLGDGKTYFIDRKTLRNAAGGVVQEFAAQIYWIIDDTDGAFYIGRYSGLYRARIRKRQFVVIDSVQRRGNHYRFIKKADTLLAASAAGVIYYKDNREVRRADERSGLSDDRVYDILEHKGSVYCATRSGVSIIRPDGIEKPAPEILADCNANVLAADEFGGVWAGTMKGLFLFWKNRVYRFDLADGFISEEVTALYCHNGFLYAGTTRGLSVASLNYLYSQLSVEPAGKAPALYLDKIYVNDSMQRLVPPLRLQPGQNNLRFVLGGVDFSDPALTEARYSLDGGSNWQLLKGREINLPSLGYGSYTLQVETRRRNQPVFQQVAAIPFSIGVPWYRQPLFIFAAALLLAAVFAFLIIHAARARRRREMHDFAVKKQILDLEQKAMAALLNPHFVFNAINSINYYIHNGEEEKYTRLLTDLSRLIRLNLNNTYKDAVTLQSELEIVQLYVAFEKHRFIRQPLGFKVAYNSRFNAEDLRIPSMLIQPFVENAIWHGILPNNGGNIWMDVNDLPGQYIEIVIKDDGVGMGNSGQQSATGGVRGMQLIQERLNAYNKLHDQPISFQLTNGQPGEGCTVRLRFPVR